MGQRYLTHILGSFRCKECNTLMLDKCFICKTVLDEKECFADDENNSYCGKCIKIFQEEKKNKELERLKAEEEAKRLDKKSISLKNTVHCDFCTKPLVSTLVDFNDAKFEFEYLACVLCEKNLKNVTCNKCTRQIGKCNFIFIF